MRKEAVPKKQSRFDSPSVPTAGRKNIPQWTRHTCNDAIDILFFNADDLLVWKMALKAKKCQVLIKADLNRTENLI